MTRVKLLGFKIAPNTLSFGMVLNENRSDCQAGVEVQTMNGLYLISERRWDEKVGELHLSFERVRSNRRSRRQKSSVEKRK